MPQPDTDGSAEIARLRAEVERLRGEAAEAERRAAYFAALAAEDPLTGLLNRRGFLAELGRAIAYVARYGTGAALLIADLDRFKPINDAHGHAAGDLVLRHVGALLRAQVRASDSVGRIGGDEFAILLWQADEPAARRKAGALAAALQGQPVRYGSALLAATASFGATSIRGEDGVESALARADQAMYAAKQANEQLGQVRR